MAVDTPVLPVTKAPADAAVCIISLIDGTSVGQEFTVRFELKGMGVGSRWRRQGAHRLPQHLLVDVKKLPAAGQPIPKDDNHLHFGGSQTETTLKLKPGMHTLQLELGDEDHPFDPPLVSKRITINAK